MIVVLLLSWIGQVALFAGAVDSHADPAETPGKMPRTSTHAAFFATDTDEKYSASTMDVARKRINSEGTAPG